MKQANHTPPYSSIDLFHLALTSLRSQCEEPLADHGLTVDRWRVLRLLAERGPQSMAELGVATGISGPTLTRVVDRLVEDTLVYRNVDSADRRRVRVHVGDRGRRLWRKLGPRLNELERSALSALSDDETQTLHRLLSTLAD
ncbi:MAG TPA: MarR family transcriptional regulator [Nocardioidaceae bacterium]|nr:MarR family transcriptional regulator [Nocardioidaceae bacterium]